MNNQERARSSKLQTLGGLFLESRNNADVNSAAVGITRPPQGYNGASTKGDCNPSNTSGSGGNGAIEEAIEAVKDALGGFGVLSRPNQDPEKVWRRPIPASLYQPPRYQPSLTTIMPRSRLPPGAKIRSTRSASNDGKNREDDLVEVWTYSLTSDYDKEGTTANDLNQRPLQGNLSSKLVEYTRGTMGVRRPFRPGGMDEDEHAPGDYDDEELEVESKYLSEEATLNARRALTMGSKKALEKGILITAPPGVSFSEGLRYGDIFDDADQLVLENSRSGDRY